jgi:hypothetical protein
MTRNITRTEILRELQRIEALLDEYSQNTGDFEDIVIIKSRVNKLWKAI